LDSDSGEGHFINFVWCKVGKKELGV